MRNLIDRFPREVAKPNRRLCHTETDFYKFINRHNGKTNLFYSVYSIDANGKFDNTKLNKIAFDFDGSDVLEDVKRFHKHLKKEDVKHLILYSGKKGFHVYLFTINYETLMSAKNTLHNSQMFFINLLDLNADLKIVGDVARIMRIPNTKHITGNRYCIPLTTADLDKGLEHIRDKAKTQVFDMKYYGNKYLDVAQFDREPDKKSVAFEIEDYKYDIPINDDTLKKFLPCVQAWLTNYKDMGTYEARYQFAVYCRDIGLSQNVCNDMARRYFSQVKRKDSLKNNYIHFKNVNALKYAYEGDVFCWNCITLMEKGICPGKCNKYAGKNFPIYRK